MPPVRERLPGHLFEGMMHRDKGVHQIVADQAQRGQPAAHLQVLFDDEEIGKAAKGCHRGARLQQNHSELIEITGTGEQLDQLGRHLREALGIAHVEDIRDRAGTGLNRTSQQIGICRDHFAGGSARGRWSCGRTAAGSGCWRSRATDAME